VGNPVSWNKACKIGFKGHGVVWGCNTNNNCNKNNGAREGKGSVKGSSCFRGMGACSPSLSQSNNARSGSDAMLSDIKQTTHTGKEGGSSNGVLHRHTTMSHTTMTMKVCLNWTMPAKWQHSGQGTWMEHGAKGAQHTHSTHTHSTHSHTATQHTQHTQHTFQGFSRPAGCCCCPSASSASCCEVGGTWGLSVAEGACKMHQHQRACCGAFFCSGRGGLQDAPASKGMLW